MPVLTILLFFVLFFDNTACAETIPQGRLIDLLPRDARWSLVAVDVKTGHELVRTGNASTEPLVPGSLVKLFTTGSVLNHSRPEMTTSLLSNGIIEDGVLKGNLYLRGGGNAFLNSDNLVSAAARLSQLKIGRVTGGIVVDDTLFDKKGLERKRKGAGYALPGALGLDLHTVSVQVSPAEAGKPPKVMVAPPNDQVRLAVSALTTGRLKGSGLHSTQTDNPLIKQMKINQSKERAMARPLRIEYPGAYYHVTSRGNEQKEIFKSQRDREKFLDYLESATTRYGAVIHAYCLMSNHYHLLLETPGGNLSQIIDLSPEAFSRSRKDAKVQRKALKPLSTKSTKGHEEKRKTPYSMTSKERNLLMIKPILGVVVFIMGIVLLGWIGYNLFFEMTPEAQGRNPLVPALLSIGFLYVGQKWIRNKC